MSRKAHPHSFLLYCIHRIKKEMIHIIFQDELREYLLANIPGARSVSSGREVVTRCVFCGDSNDPKHRHLYISLGTDDKPPMYNCFKCGTSGILTPKVLKDLGLYDGDIHERLRYNNKNLSKKHPRMFREGNVYSLRNKFIRNDPVSYKKLEYINSRLGLNLSFKDAINNKIVLNLFDLLQSNYLRLMCDEKFATELDEHFVGFLSEDNNILIERNIDSKLTDLRYHKYNIHGGVNSEKRYYILPCNIDLSIPEPIDVHIAEGPFDILSIKYNVATDNWNRSLFAAIGGKSYKTILKHVIVHMGLMNINIHLYVDADVSDYVIKGIARDLAPFNHNIYLHRNGFDGEKDYGVPKDHIIDTVTILNRRK